MTSESHITLLAQTTFCDKLYRSTLVERPGFSPQIQIQTLAFLNDALEPVHKHTMALRLGPAAEIAQAILRGVELHRSKSAADAGASA